ncbi:hypothetical protein L211DRAFT_463614 [Terfezia boudieri ATCC MYA-4762]|uniref:H-type lectin domain-containing protein n=1 Tax=Terfezia boudieri ATCC MYA-4762 TaxID=1051890 RepID=A0A3N4LE66_9PEZI|nr:hypothetical protein L211DRAFT_463614 [Terfezia boudieri ATCC MYA-4762]
MSAGQEFSLSLFLKIDSGTWNTKEVRDSHPVEKTEGRVNFSKKFTSLPTVIVSLSSLEILQGCRVNVYATHICLEGFTIHADSWYDTELFTCGVSWLAIGQ